jgi:hypothetical protein
MDIICLMAHVSLAVHLVSLAVDVINNLYIFLYSKNNLKRVLVVLVVHQVNSFQEAPVYPVTLIV